MDNCVVEFVNKLPFILLVKTSTTNSNVMSDLLESPHVASLRIDFVEQLITEEHINYCL